MLRPKSKEERRATARKYVRVAQRFLDEGKRETEEGIESANREKVREGAEKVFHALIEACGARIYDYGRPIPDNHDEMRGWLRSAREGELANLYRDAFERLHTTAYYRGWFDADDLRRTVQSIENAIKQIARKLEGPVNAD